MHELATKYVKYPQLALITKYAKDNHYSQQLDVYHNWEHVEKMLNMLSEVVEEQKLIELSPKMYLCLYIAILYHDADYVPCDVNNEERAMELVKNLYKQPYIKQCGLEELMENVGKYAAFLIGSTKSHAHCVNNIEYLDNKAVALLHDLDYMGFATEYELDCNSDDVDLTNELKLENEYFGVQPHSPNDETRFCSNRLMFLQSLARSISNNKYLYLSDCFRDLDLKAYINIVKLQKYYANRLAYLEVQEAAIQDKQYEYEEKEL